MPTMRAVAADQLGSTSSLAVRELPVPEPGPGEVRVRVHASAVNPADQRVAEDEFFARVLHSRKPPVRFGYDLSGVVDALGPGVSGLAVGDRVWGHQQYAGATEHGAWAEATVLAADAVAKLPDGVDHATAAAAATAGLTALQALRDKGGLGAGGRALIIGASGGVGSLAVGVARRLGAEVTAVCSGPAAELVRGLGADRVLDRREADPYAGGGPYDVIFDTPAAVPYGAVASLLGPRGVYITTLPGPGLALGKLRTLLSGRRCEFIAVRSLRADLEQLGAWLADGMQAPIDSRFPVREAAAAVEAIKGGGRRGRIVVDVVDGW